MPSKEKERVRRRDKAFVREKDIVEVRGSESEVEDTKGLTAKYCCLMIGQTILGFDWSLHLPL